MNSRFCPDCGSKLSSLDRYFCTNCGNTLDQRPRTNSIVEQEVFETPVKKSPKTNYAHYVGPLVIFGIVILSIILIFPTATTAYITSQKSDFEDLYKALPVESSEEIVLNEDLLSYAPDSADTVYYGNDIRAVLDKYLAQKDGGDQFFEKAYTLVRNDFVYFESGTTWVLLASKSDSEGLDILNDANLKAAYLGNYIFIGNNENIINAMQNANNKLAKSILNSSDFVKVKNNSATDLRGFYIRHNSNINVLSIN